MDNFDQVNSLFSDMYTYSLFGAFLQDPPLKFKHRVLRLLLHIYEFLLLPVFWILQLISVFEANEVIQERCLSLLVLLQFTQTWLKIYFFIRNHKVLKEFLFNFETFSINRYRKSYACKVLSKRANLIRRVFHIFYTMIIGNLLIFWIVAPIIQKVVGDSMGYNTGRIRIMPTSYLYFTQMHHASPFRELVMVYDAILISMSICHFLMADILLATIIVMYCTQMDILNQALYSWVPGSRSLLCLSDVPLTPDPKDNLDPMPIRSFVIEHQRMLSLYTKLVVTLQPLLTNVLITSMIIICLQTFLLQLTDMRELTTAEKTVVSCRYAVFFFGSLSDLFVFCWICTALKDSKESTAVHIYFSPWYESDLQYKKAALRVMMTVTNPRPITANGLGKIQLSTFIDVMRLSYSYFTFLRGFADKHSP